MPVRMRMLDAWLAEAERKEARECYVGDALWTVTRLMCKELSVPPLSELMQESRVRDDRTAEDIVAEIVEMLGK